MNTTLRTKTFEGLQWGARIEPHPHSRTLGFIPRGGDLRHFVVLRSRGYIPDGSDFLIFWSSRMCSCQFALIFTWIWDGPSFRTLLAMKFWLKQTKQTKQRSLALPWPIHEVGVRCAEVGQDRLDGEHFASTTIRNHGASAKGKGESNGPNGTEGLFVPV